MIIGVTPMPPANIKLHVAVSSSGAGTVWAGAALLVVIGALGAGALARRGPSR